jgi:hypothetical protein
VDGRNTVVNSPNACSATNIKDPTHIAVLLIEWTEAKLAIVGVEEDMVL